MKNLKFKLKAFAALIIVSLLFTGCPGEDKDPDTLSVTPTRLSFKADDTEEKSVEITTNVSSWNYKEESSDWIDAYRKSDNKLYIKVRNHTNTSSSRTSKITISAGDATPVDITIEQSAKEINSFSVSPTSLSFQASETGDKTIAVNTNAENWDAISDASWITLTKQTGTLKVTVGTKNTQTTERTANIKITAGNAPDITVKVTQGAATTLSVNATSLSYEATETGEKSVAISTNASSWSATASASWITLSQSGNTLKVNVTSANTNTSARNANVTITAGDATPVVISVTQAAATSLSVNPTSLSYGASETGTKSVTVTTNASSWDATANASWITLSKSGNTLSVRISSANTATSTRSATITVTAGDAASTTLIVTQAAATGTPGGIVKSSYSATGTVFFSSLGSATSWSGIITPYGSSGSKTYSITNWGNEGITVWLDESNGKIMMDITTSVAHTSGYTHYGYFRAGIVVNGVLNVISDYVHPVSYNSSTKVLDFSSTTFQGYQVYVGIAAYKSGVLDDFFTNFYRSVKFSLTSTSSASLSDEAPMLKSAASAPILKSATKRDYTSVRETTMAEFIKTYGKNTK
ncbi:MAG: hypothetical protein LBV74_10370 [Tannerella sp.]|jgi:hypothetical protein|nr:hypothetical protein [Tannerella sp.]